MTSFTPGGNIEDAVTFLTHMGPASSVISNSDVDDTIKSGIITDLRAELFSHDTGVGVSLGAATWIATAPSTEVRTGRDRSEPPR